MGSKKSKSTSTTKVVLDPQTQELNAMRLAQERLYAPHRARAAQLVGNVFDPSVSLPTGRGAGYRDLQGQIIPGQNLEDVYGNIPGLRDIKFTDPETAVAASRLAALTDVTGLQRSAQQHVNKVVAPELLAQAIASGMGRGGAGLEAIAKASGQFTIPIEQARIGAENRLADFLTGRSDLRTQLASGVSDPARMQFMSAPTQTTTTKQSTPGFGLGSLLGLAGTIGGSLLGGPFGGSLGGMLGSFGGGGGGYTSWNIPQMAGAYRL